MREEAYRQLADRDQSYWWHVARRDLCEGLLRRNGLPEGARWLDLGSGAGGSFALAERMKASATGLEISPVARALSRERFPGVPVMEGDLNHALPFADESFDLITLLNVLYHQWVREEKAVIAEATRALRPGGLLLLTEPAFARLARGNDRLAMGARRYRIGEAKAWCENAGLEVIAATYFTSFGVPLAYGLKRTGLEQRPLSHLANQLLLRLARAEARYLVRGNVLPFGTTLLCLARKPRDEAANVCRSR